MSQSKTVQRIKETVSTMTLKEGQAAFLLRLLERGIPNEGVVHPQRGADLPNVDDITAPPPPPRVRAGLGDEVQFPSHLEDGGLLTVGGMGEIRRVYDRTLRRHLVMKVLRADLKDDSFAMQRFFNEAQVTAQLEHPGIVPVHEMGHLSDHRPFFTMREIRGRTLEDVIRDVHSVSSPMRWGVTSNGWSFQKLIQAFRQICEAVSFAHSRGVIHRDLKPANLLLGEYGVVQVVDWGLTKVLSNPSPPLSTAPKVKTDSTESGSHITVVGVVSGTVAYMPPEQAKGDMDSLDATADVYALGAILYEILCGCPPYDGRDWDSVWKKVMEGPPPSLLSHRQPFAPPIPTELAHVVEKAMRRDRMERFSDASRMGDRLGAWIDGDVRRKRALRVSDQARSLLPRVRQLKSDALRLRKEAEGQLNGLPAWAPVEDKRLGWELEDRAQSLEEEAGLEEARFLQLAQGALIHDPDLLEARTVLAEYYQEKHRQAERAKDKIAAGYFEAFLSAQRSKASEEYLEGNGLLTLSTNPSGAMVSLYEYKLRDRRLNPVFLRSLESTPIVKQVLPRGSYLLKIQSEGYETALYPIFIERNQFWDGVGPDAVEALSIELLPEGHLTPEDNYIPAGWFYAGGDKALSIQSPSQRVWIEPYVMRRHPVTNGEFLSFLNDLVRREAFAEAESYQPREWTGEKDQRGMPIYSRAAEGRFVLGKDKDGLIWKSEWPVVLIGLEAAQAYARWFEHKTGKPWRLPREYEWEKAARGVDGRYFPWGSFFDPTWVNVRESHAEQMLEEVAAQSSDISPYGVWGLSGNVMEWTQEPFVTSVPPALDGCGLSPLSLAETPPHVVVRGGAWSLYSAACRSSFRSGMSTRVITPMLGFRLVYSL